MQYWLNWRLFQNNMGANRQDKRGMLALKFSSKDRDLKGILIALILSSYLKAGGIWLISGLSEETDAFFMVSYVTYARASCCVMQ